MKKPHKHAEVIKAWADGAEIEYLETMTSKEPYWSNAPMPKWSEETMYRVKPEPKPDLTLFYFVSDHVVQCSSKIHIHNLALTFDANTGVLKSAEVV